jgi:hypothetical protein
MNVIVQCKELVFVLMIANVPWMSAKKQYLS